MTTKTFAASRLVLLPTAITLSGSILAQSQSPTADPAVNAYLDAIPRDLRADKAQLITDAMQFNDKEAAAFWPVYKTYEAEEARLDEERMQLVRRYADPWTTLTDGEARGMTEKSLALESRRADPRSQYFDRFNQVLPGLTVAKIF